MMTSSQHQAWLFQNRWRSGNQANTNRLKQFIGYILAKPHRHTTVLPRCLRRSEEHTSELQSLTNLVCRLLLEKKKKKIKDKTQLQNTKHRRLVCKR